MEAVVGEETNEASPQKDVLVDHNVGGALGREFGRRDGLHVCAPAERSVKRRMQEFSLGVTGRGSK